MLSIIVGVFGVFALAQTDPCTRSGMPAWSSRQTSVLPGCQFQATSPNGRFLLRIDSEGNVSFGKSEGELRQIASIEPPAMVSWSPASTHFLINDGEASGMTSVLRMFVVTDDNALENTTFYQAAVDRFRSEKRCGNDTLDPNVWGLGWSERGDRVYLLVQASVHQPCGQSASFMGVVVTAKDGVIVEQLSEAGTRRRFRSLLPAELR